MHFQLPKADPPPMERGPRNGRFKFNAVRQQLVDNPGQWFKFAENANGGIAYARGGVCRAIAELPGFERRVVKAGFDEKTGARRFDIYLRYVGEVA